MHTQSDAIAHMTEATEATGVIPNASAEHDLAYAAEQVTQAREDLRAAEAARDELLTRAAHTGVATQSRLAQLAGLTRARVHQIINR